MGPGLGWGARLDAAPGPALSVLIGALCVLGAASVLTAAVAMLRERDAYARINVLGLATSLGLPLLVAAAWLQRTATTGFDLVDLLKALVTVAALWGVSSVGSMTLARAAYLAGTPVDPATDPQDLADDHPDAHN